LPYNCASARPAIPCVLTGVHVCCGACCSSHAACGHRREIIAKLHKALGGSGVVTLAAP
jgi:hypothetical protein